MGKLQIQALPFFFFAGSILHSNTLSSILPAHLHYTYSTTPTPIHHNTSISTSFFCREPRVKREPSSSSSSVRKLERKERDLPFFLHFICELVKRTESQHFLHFVCKLEQGRERVGELHFCTVREREREREQEVVCASYLSSSPSSLPRAVHFLLHPQPVVINSNNQHHSLQ